MKNLSLLYGYSYNSSRDGICLMSKSLKTGYNTIIGEMATLNRWGDDGKRFSIDIVRKRARCVGSRRLNYAWGKGNIPTEDFTFMEKKCADNGLSTYKEFFGRFIFEKGYLDGGYGQTHVNDPCMLNIFFLGNISFTLRNK